MPTETKTTPLLERLRFFTPTQVVNGGGPGSAWRGRSRRSREWERLYRGRWQHDKVVRTTHGVNCTGSCSWKVHVKDGLVTWETQQTDYPSNGPDSPEYEPRGCPRGASFSWYIYSPLRVRHPYVRGALLRYYREELQRTGDPVDAWAAIVEDPEKARSYKSQRGMGGFLRSSWDEVSEIIGAAHVYTIKTFGPDRVMGFSPIPAMSQVSYAAGSRFLSLIGGVALSFYDWYCDLPPASPQVWGDQTDVPESADWWNSSYVMLWGSNIPQTRTPDAHFMSEARYKGQKVVVVSPDFAGNTKFADHWLCAEPGTDAALALGMAHVILKEHYVDRQTPYFDRYARQFTDLPFLVSLRERDGAYVADHFLNAEDIGEQSENAEWKTVVLDEATNEPVVPKGSVGFRWGDEGTGKWSLDLGEMTPRLTILGAHDELVPLDLPRFDGGPGEGGAVMRRGVPAKRIGDKLVTTVFDLLCAQLGVARENLPGEWPTDFNDPLPCTPAWQEEQTRVSASLVTQIAREFARNAEVSEGRSMVIMGAGVNHWFHSDQTYRAILSLVMLCGCQGVNGGGWAHYVGQEKVRPITGFGVLGFATDWTRPPRQQAATAFWYMVTDQYRYDRHLASDFASPLGPGRMKDMHTADCVVQSARLGWQPSYPTLNRNPLTICDEAEAQGKSPQDFVVEQLRSGELQFAVEDPDNPVNFPRVLTIWRGNLLGSSSKGHEYFLRHLLGAGRNAVTATESPEDMRPREVTWHEQAPEGKVDLVTTIDFRMNGSALYSDIVLPAATWYEKDDISSTDMHPFVHSFNAAVPPPWETRTDWQVFNIFADRVQELGAKHLGVRRDLVAAPLQHDTAEEISQPGGIVRDWKHGECEPEPGKTMPKLVVVERDYSVIAEKMRSLGPLVETQGIAWKGIAWKPEQEVEELRHENGAVRSGVGEGRPSLERDVDVAEAIFRLSGTTNGRMAVEGFKFLEKRSGQRLAGLAEERADERITLADVRSQPRKVVTSPEWSGIESRDRRYSPFTVNVDCELPWRTLTGRQQFYLDHEWMLELGEGLPAYRPPLATFHHGVGDLQPGEAEVLVRWITPHSKWSIHSTYQDNLHMLTLSRGGPVAWLSPGDAATVGVVDNDWIEILNRNGVIACRVIVSHRIPDGAAFMYHSQDRHVYVPISETSGTRGGTDNAVTRIVPKPTHLIGGYAQLSFGFNYYGAIGSQRDSQAIVRKRLSEVKH